VLGGKKALPAAGRGLAEGESASLGSSCMISLSNKHPQNVGDELQRHDKMAMPAPLATCHTHDADSYATLLSMA